MRCVSVAGPPVMEHEPVAVEVGDHQGLCRLAEIDVPGSSQGCADVDAADTGRFDMEELRVSAVQDD
jgi:hypothetical protein